MKSGWGFTLMPKLVPAVNLHHQAGRCPSHVYLQVGSSEYEPKATFGLGSYSHSALLALTTGLDRGSTTYFSTSSIRSPCSRAAPVSNTACCSCRRGGWAADLTKLKGSGTAIPFRVVHQLNNMRLLQNLPAFIPRDTGEAKGGNRPLSLTAPGDTLSPGRCPYALKQHLSYACIFLKQCLSKAFFK